MFWLQGWTKYIGGDGEPCDVEIKYAGVPIKRFHSLLTFCFVRFLLCFYPLLLGWAVIYKRPYVGIMYFKKRKEDKNNKLRIPRSPEYMQENH